jgi:hypothetical protein
MNPKSVLDEAKAIISERGEDYGNEIENNFQRISALFHQATDNELTASEVAVFMVCLKLSRIREAPMKRDSYIDAIAYLAFAAELNGAK